MLVVDSSVWIDFFNGVDAPAVDLLAQLDESEQDLVLQHPVLERVASAKMPLFIPSRRWMPLRRALKARKRLLRRHGGSGITQGFKAP